MKWASNLIHFYLKYASSARSFAHTVLQKALSIELSVQLKIFFLQPMHQEKPEALLICRDCTLLVSFLLTFRKVNTKPRCPLVIIIKYSKRSRRPYQKCNHRRMTQRLVLRCIWVCREQEGPSRFVNPVNGPGTKRSQFQSSRESTLVLRI